MDARRLNRVRRQLAELIEQTELEAAHHREFILDGEPAPPVVVHALKAAVAGGYATALRHVLDLLTE